MSIAQKTHHRFLILMPMGIGDAAVVGLSTTDQIIKNEQKRMATSTSSVITCKPTFLATTPHKPGLLQDRE